MFQNVPKAPTAPHQVAVNLLTWELHDELLGPLAVLYYMLLNIESEKTGGYDAIQAEASAIINRLHHFEDFLLTNDALDLEKLIGADWLHPLQIHFRPDPPKLEGLPGAFTFRIIQESLSNVRRHAEARNCYIAVRLTDTAYWCLIRDDGRGIGTNPQKGGGLNGMFRRVRLLGGRLKVRSEPGKGTTVLASLPLRNLPGEVFRRRPFLNDFVSRMLDRTNAFLLELVKDSVQTQEGITSRKQQLRELLDLLSGMVRKLRDSQAVH